MKNNKTAEKKPQDPLAQSPEDNEFSEHYSPENVEPGTDKGPKGKKAKKITPTIESLEADDGMEGAVKDIRGEETLYSYEIRIPKDRIAVLIGKKGEIKKEIENSLNAAINIDSKEGDVAISGKDALRLMTGRDVIKAIGRGFNPYTALLLLKPDYALDVLNLADVARSPNDLARLKGRIIGAGGKARRVIEDLTESNINIYGKTVSIIGEIDCAMQARRAIEMLIAGSCHRNVYKWLERQRKTMRLRRGFSDEVDSHSRTT